MVRKGNEDRWVPLVVWAGKRCLGSVWDLRIRLLGGWVAYLSFAVLSRVRYHVKCYDCLIFRSFFSLALQEWSGLGLGRSKD